jgi:hypothetical protein
MVRVSAGRTREGEEDAPLEEDGGAGLTILVVEAAMSGGSAPGDRDRRLLGGPASSSLAFLLLPAGSSGSGKIFLSPKPNLTSATYVIVKNGVVDTSTVLPSLSRQ